MKKSFDVPEEKRIKLGNYIKKLRLEKGYGFNQFAIKANINVADLSRIEKAEKKKINAYQLMNIAQALKIDYRELYQIVGYLDKKAPIESNIDTGFKYKNIPFYKSISAGLGLEELEDEEVEFISVPDTKQFSGDVVAIKVSGDSMEYTIENGSVVFVRKDVEVPNKKVGAFIHNNQALLKRYVCLGADCFLRSDNREYPDIPVSADDDFEIVGRVIGQIEAVD